MTPAPIATLRVVVCDGKLVVLLYDRHDQRCDMVSVEEQLWQSSLSIANGQISSVLATNAAGATQLQNAAGGIVERPAFEAVKRLLGVIEGLLANTVDEVVLIDDPADMFPLELMLLPNSHDFVGSRCHVVRVGWRREPLRAESVTEMRLLAHGTGLSRQTITAALAGPAVVALSAHGTRLVGLNALALQLSPGDLYSTLDLDPTVASPLVVMHCCHVGSAAGLSMGLAVAPTQTFTGLLVKRGCRHVIGALCALPTEEGAALLGAVLTSFVGMGTQPTPFPQAWIEGRQAFARSSLGVTARGRATLACVLYATTLATLERV